MNELFEAVKKGDAEVVKSLLAGGALVDAVNQYGYTPLHWAAKNGYKAVVDLLLEAGADIKLLKKDSVERELCQNILNGLLRSAVISNNIVKVQAYIAIGAGVNATDDDGETPLHLAAAIGQAAIVAALLDGGADVDAVSQNRRTPLHWAVRNGCEAVVRLLLAAGALVDAVDLWGGSALIFAAENGYEAVVDLLLETGADITLLKKDSVERELCQNILNGLLRSAVISNNIVKVQAYIAIGAGVNATDGDGAMPLHWAASRGHAAVVAALLDGGADVDAVSQNRRTPLHWAVRNGCEAVVRLLLAAGALVDAVDLWGGSALIFAAKYGYEAVVQVLLAAGAKVNAVDKQGYTPLRIARDGPTYDAIKAYIDSKQHQWRRHLQALRSSALHQQKTSNFHLVELFPDNIKRKFIASFFERLSPLLAFSKILNPRLAEGNKENSSPAASVALDIVELIAGFIEPRIPTLLNVISRSLKDHPEVLEVYAKVLESLNQLQSYINTHTGKKERQKAALDIQEKLLALTESRKIFNSENVLEEIIANLTEESYAEVFKTHSVNKVISFFPLAGGCELAYTKLEGVLASIQKIFSPDSVGINFNKLKDSLQAQAQAQAQAQPEPEVAAAQPEPVASPEAVASPEPEPKEAEAGRPAATTTFFVAAAEAVGAAGSASPEPDGTELKVVC